MLQCSIDLKGLRMFNNLRQFARGFRPTRLQVFATTSHNDLIDRTNSDFPAIKVERDLLRTSLRWNKM